jgi:hypothetical protein
MHFLHINLIFHKLQLTIMSKLAKYLILDLEEDWSKPSIKFFRSSGAYGYIIWLFLIDSYFSVKKITVEDVVVKLEKYASRRTIIDFLNKGVDAKFLEKDTSLDDKRKTIITPSNTTIEEYKVWSENFIKSVV